MNGQEVTVAMHPMGKRLQDAARYWRGRQHNVESEKAGLMMDYLATSVAGVVAGVGMAGLAVSAQNIEWLAGGSAVAVGAPFVAGAYVGCRKYLLNKKLKNYQMAGAAVDVMLDYFRAPRLGEDRPRDIHVPVGAPLPGRNDEHAARVLIRECRGVGDALHVLAKSSGALRHMRGRSEPDAETLRAMSADMFGQTKRGWAYAQVGEVMIGAAHVFNARMMRYAETYPLRAMSRDSVLKGAGDALSRLNRWWDVADPDFRHL
ncbi:MAG: hypothetical protein H6922_01875 [Pseudomonadaceae bacterium]|nr:hypothetical protein [Pseudomonadaceae bacterium]